MQTDTMLVAHVRFEVEPARRAEALAFLAGQVAQVRAMQGSLMFLPFADPAAPGTVRLVHEWQRGADFDAYLASPAFAALGAALRPMMTAPPESRRFDAVLRRAAA